MLGFLAGVPGKLKTLTDRLTSGRAANLDNLNATITSRASASSALANTTWTDARAGYLDAAVSSVARINSIQHVNASFGAGTDPTAVSAVITISAVTTAKAIVIFNGVTGSNSPDWSSRLYLSSSTTLQFIASRYAANSSIATVSAVVVEFY